MDWELISIPNLKLTGTEHRYYSDIFIYCCDNTETNSVPISKAVELLRSANLPSDVLSQILEICGGNQKSYILERKQFYAVLKLVAVHQAGLEISIDTITASVNEIALPRFTWSSNTSDEVADEDTEMCPIESFRNSKFHNREIQQLTVAESTTESESEPDSLRETEDGSTDSPTPTNSVSQDTKILDPDMGNDEVLCSNGRGWQGISEEQRQLLGTEEESSERHSSDEGDNEYVEGFPPEQVWIINDEQRTYYTKQFLQLQPNLEGIIAGHVARMFFEKSRLPVRELRQIWQLADVTRDGALSLQEFYLAMHLVVLRRNQVPLPDTLPASLSVSAAQHPASALPVIRSIDSPLKYSTEKSKEWTKFAESPIGSTCLTSPGPKPVNFDFQKAAVESDPKILHPVPLRLTPEAAILASNANGSNRNSQNLGEEDIIQISTSIVVGQRHLTKKPVPTPDDAVAVTPKKEPPPPPPPRPYRTHTRSSSLDLNKLGKNGQGHLGTPPIVPPRISPGICSRPIHTTSPKKLTSQKNEVETERIGTNCIEGESFVADFSHFSPKLENNIGLENNICLQQFAGICGAFHIYKKPSPRQNDNSKEKRRIHEEKELTLQELRDRNTELRQICEELTRELAIALQERINLKAKLLLLT